MKYVTTSVQRQSALTQYNNFAVFDCDTNSTIYCVMVDQKRISSAQLSPNCRSAIKQTKSPPKQSPTKQASPRGVLIPCGASTPQSASLKSTSCTSSTATPMLDNFKTPDRLQSPQESLSSPSQSLNEAKWRLHMLNITSESSGRIHRTNISTEVTCSRSNTEVRGMLGTKVEGCNESKTFDEHEAHTFDWHTT